MIQAKIEPSYHFGSAWSTHWYYLPFWSIKQNCKICQIVPFGTITNRKVLANWVNALCAILPFVMRIRY